MERRGLPMLNHVLQHTLRSLCCETQWVYTVFWRILPRNYPPPKWDSTEGTPADRSKGNKRNWILVWEDGFCDFASCSRGKEARIAASRYGCRHHHGPSSEIVECAEIMSPELFFKMSHEVYNYGEGLMGKVAADNSHKWVYREPMEHEISFLSPWHGSLDPHPRTWEAQFKAGIQTIAVISVREGLIQLGSTKKVFEDLNFVIFMQRKFNYLQSIPGVFVPHPSAPPTGASDRSGGSVTVDGSSSPPPDESFFWSSAPGRIQHPAHATYSSKLSGPDHPDRLTAPQKRFKSDDLGIRRQFLDISPGSATGGRDFPFLSPGNDLDDGGGCQSDCPLSPSPSKSLGAASGPGQGSSDSVLSLLPSMSSLHNLLSKLPSVTGPPDSPSQGTESPRLASSSPNAIRPLQEQQQPSEDPPAEDAMPSPRCSSGSALRQQQLHKDELGPLSGAAMAGASAGPSQSTSPPQQSDADRDGGLPREPGTSRYDGNSVQKPSLFAGRSDINFDSPESPHNHTSLPGQQHYHPGMTSAHGTGGAAAVEDEDKRTSFLDSFVQDSLTDLEFHQDLENSDTYHALLGEIMH